MNLENIQTIYLIGIKGVGMTMLAQFLKSQNFEVIGSDTEESFMTDEVLHEHHIEVKEGFSPDNVETRADMIIYSSAYNSRTNSELKYILDNPDKFPQVFSYAQALGEIFSQYFGIAVSGSHGKTTTSALLGYTFQKAGLDPNVLVGSKVKQFEGNILTGNSNYFICEVDEYQDKLQYFNPKIEILNNIDYDHHDYFSNEQEYLDAFSRFVQKLDSSGTLVINFDYGNLRELLSNTEATILSYGFKDIDKQDFFQKQKFYLQAHNLQLKDGYQVFQVTKITSESSHNLGEFKLKLTGEHNVLNALAVLSLSLQQNIALETIQSALSEFAGTSRRQEVLGEYQGAEIIDDYAHHPTEIKYTLQTVKEKYPDKELVTVFHPHTYTRTKALLEEFAHSFNDTDKLILLDIYGSARETKQDISSLDLLKQIQQHSPHLEVTYIPTIEEVTEYVRENLNSDQVLLLMGAGDVFRVGENLLNN